MISHIEIKRFKALFDQSLNLNNLTVLSGLNGSGKSTLLQALGALKQSFTSGDYLNGLNLQGSLVNIGKGYDALHQDADSDSIEIALTEEDTSKAWSFGAKLDSAFLPLISGPYPRPQFTQDKHFQYIQASRLPPDTLYPEDPLSEGDSFFLGAQGQFTVDVLERHGDLQTSSAMKIPPFLMDEWNSDLIEKVAPTSTLTDQTAAWLQLISPGISLQIQKVKNTDNVTIYFSYKGADGRSHTSLRPTNIGFGISYTLPIVVALLVAKPGSLILLENPEAHLHPSGQLALGALIALAAEFGVQVIAETHSDHLINGIRLCTMSGFSNNENVKFHHFAKIGNDLSPQVISPYLYEDGSLSDWPEGFFDEWDKFLDRIF